VIVMERGVWKEITTANTDVTVMEIPKNKLAEIKKVEVRNPTTSDARVRLWDTFTDVEKTSHRREKFDHTISAGDSIIADVEESKQVLGKLVAQSTAVTIQIYVGVELR